MIKNFKQFLNESFHPEDDHEVFEDYYIDLASDTFQERDFDEEEEREAVLDGYVHMIDALYATSLSNVGIPEEVILQLLDSIISLGSPDSDDGGLVLFRSLFPNLLDESGSLARALRPTEIWEDEYWSGSPGSNSIYIIDQPEGRLCCWQYPAEGSDGWFYTTKETLENALRKNPALHKQFPNMLETLQSSKKFNRSILDPYKTKIASKKYGLS